MLETTAYNQNNRVEVPEETRLEMLPKYFGEKHMMRVEASIYGTIHNLCEEYAGGYWNYYEIPNGFYMAPSQNSELTVLVSGNNFQEPLSADAAGIVTCLFVYCHFANVLQDERFTDLYHALREYSVNHDESSQIFRAID